MNPYRFKAKSLRTYSWAKISDCQYEHLINSFGLELTFRGARYKEKLMQWYFVFLDMKKIHDISPHDLNNWYDLGGFIG